MQFNKEMFHQTIKAAGLSYVTFYLPISYDEPMLNYGKDYINTLLSEPSIIAYVGGDADRYYYMIATHALYAGFYATLQAVAGHPFEKSMDEVKCFDAIALFKSKYRTISADDIDWFASDVYDLAINDFEHIYHQEYVINNDNEYMIGLLLAFFVIGCNLREEHFKK